MLRSRSRSRHCACKISRKRAPVIIKRRIAATANGSATVRRLSRLRGVLSLWLCLIRLPWQALRLRQAQRIPEAAELRSSQVTLFALLAIALDTARGIFFEADLIPTSGPIPDSRNDGNGAICRARRRRRNGSVKPRDMNSVHIGDAHAADCRQDVAVQKDLISLARSRLTLRPNMGLKERSSDLAERRHGSLGALGRDRINALLDGSEKPFCGRTRFVWR